MTTIRQHLDRAVWFSDMGRSGSATKEIKAALRILDGCKREMVDAGIPMVRQWEEPTDNRLVPDPEDSL